MRTKELKNNKTMRTGVILAAIAIITLIALVITFAKYASQGTGEDSARVAKWGLNSNIPNQLDLFDPSYTGTDDKTTVDSSDGSNVVAPGTTKSLDVKLANFTNNEAPEVMYHFEPSIEIENGYVEGDTKLLDKLDDLPGWYWILGTNGGETKPYKTVAELKAAVKGLQESDIAPNTMPTTSTIQLGWKWAFDDSGNNTWDASDTELGNLIASGQLTGMKVTLNLNAYQCQGCSKENVNLSGTVKTSNGDTVKNAFVTYTYSVANESKTVTTDDNGQYSMSVPKNSSGTLNAYKDNYNSPSPIDVPTLAGDTVIDIIGLDPIMHTVTFQSNPSGSADVTDNPSTQTPIESVKVPHGTNTELIDGNTILVMNGVKYYPIIKTGYTLNCWMDVGQVNEDKIFTVLCDETKKENSWDQSFNPDKSYSSYYSTSPIGKSIYSSGQAAAQAKYGEVKYDVVSESKVSTDKNFFAAIADSINDNETDHFYFDGEMLTCKGSTPAATYNLQIKAYVEESTTYTGLESIVDVTWTVTEQKKTAVLQLDPSLDQSKYIIYKCDKEFNIIEPATKEEGESITISVATTDTFRIIRQHYSGEDNRAYLQIDSSDSSVVANYCLAPSDLEQAKDYKNWSNWGTYQYGYIDKFEQLMPGSSSVSYLAGTYKWG